MQCSLVKLADKAQKGEGGPTRCRQAETRSWSNPVDCANVEGDEPSENDAQRARKRSRERRANRDLQREKAAERERETRLEIDANKRENTSNESQAA